jgi:hypothetical protein
MIGIDPLIERVRRRGVSAIAIAMAIAAFLTGTAGGSGEPSPLFVATNPMTQARENGTATVLQNGKVLMTGGQDSSGTSTANAEVYDPATGSFNFINVMSIPRKFHTAVLLSNGTVLITGGIDADGNFLNTAEIYDPVAGQFTCVGGVSATPPLCNPSMSDHRANHTATVLPNGQVLITGGQDAAGTPVNTAEIFDPPSAQFICVGGVSANPPLCNPSMTDNREGHTATSLDDGTVLIVGGKDSATNIVNTAERFTPASAVDAAAGAFKSTGSMSDTRINHTATLLPGGTVLIAGGYDGLDVLATAEVYNPASGTFSPTESSSTGLSTMTTPRQNHSATLLGSGQVLLAGGDNNGVILRSGEIYDPPSGVFAAVASQMAQPRESHTATLLNDGLVLIAGGAAPSLSPLVVNEAELFDPTPGFFVPSGPMATARQYDTASTLFTGPALIAGGQNALGPLATSELYNGTTFTPGPTMSTPRLFHTATLFPKFISTSCTCEDQFVVLAGGIDNGGLIHADADLYDVSLNLMLQAVPGGFTLNTMSHPRLGHTSTVLLVGNMGFYAGGMTSDGSVLNNADIFNPTTGAFSPSTGTMISSRVFHTASQLLDGTVLLAGGRDTNGNILNSAELYNPVADTFAAVPNPMTDAREFHTATLLNTGMILIAGGLDDNGATATAELYDLTTKTFTAVGRMSVARYFHSATLLPDGEVLIAGGEGNNNLVINEAEIFNPATASFRLAPGLMLSPRFGQAATPLESGLVLFAGGADDGFNALSSSELYDPPTGPVPAGVLASISKSVKSGGVHNSLVNAGAIQATNIGGSAENFSSVTVALSRAAIFSRVILTGEVFAKSRRTQTETATVVQPGSTATFTFKKPLSVLPGGSVTFTLTSLLGSLKRAGATATRPARSIQTATALEVSRNSGAVQVQGLPAGFGMVTLR